MPFSDTQFAAAWTVLEDRYNRKHNLQTVAIYRSILEAELTAPQFADACRAAFRLDTYFPSPQRLIDLGLGGLDFQHRALEIWDRAIASIRGWTDQPELTKEERKILMGATNGEYLGQINTDQLPWVKKEFTERYIAHQKAQAVKATPALTDGEVTRVLG